MKLDIPYYISTNNKHLDCLEVYIHLYNKFMDNNELKILGYDEPNFELADNCKFISMGKQGSVEEWSTDLRNYFSNIEDEHFIYSTEDVFFYKQSNIRYLNYLVDFVKINDWIGRLNLSNIGEENGDTMLNSRHYTSSFIQTIPTDFGKINLHKLVNSAYHLTCQPSIWRKDYLLKYLVDGMTPWQFEGQTTAQQDTEHSVVMLDNVYPLFKKEGYAGKRGWEYTEFWVNEIDDLNLKNKILNRSNA